MADLGKVALLYGGNSREKVFSQDVSMILESLERQGIAVTLLDPSERSITELASEGFTRVYCYLCGLGGEDGSIQGALEHLHIPYTGWLSLSR